MISMLEITEIILLIEPLAISMSVMISMLEITEIVILVETQAISMMTLQSLCFKCSAFRGFSLFSRHFVDFLARWLITRD
jgi:hypothetical protein